MIHVVKSKKIIFHVYNYFKDLANSNDEVLKNILNRHKK